MPGNKKSPAEKFSDGEKILCFHGPLLYEAKVSKVQHATKEKPTEYLIHYNGWSKSWDEWVNEDRIQKVNDAALQKQKDLLRQYPQAERQKKVGSKRKMDKKKELEGPLRKRRTRYDASECSTRDSSPQRQDINLVYPEEVKKRLIDDWDLVTRQKQLVNLPKQLTVALIINQFQEHMVDSKPELASSGQLTEVCTGLVDYFDVMLGTQLLYKFERPQYADILQNHSDKSPSQVFGIEHLLRLFVRLNVMLSYTVMEEDNLILIQSLVQDLIKYIDDNLSSIETNYDAAPAEYLRRLT